jgi:ankyrin repeat protein
MPKDTIISFFFNARGGDRLETSLEGMYRSLLHQLLTAFPLLQTGRRLSKVALCAEQDWPTQTLEALFHDAVLDLDPGQNHLTCFIDALDECPEDNVRAMLKSLGSLSDAALDDGIDLHICFSSRHYPHITFERCQHLILDGQEGHEQDISTYVQNELVGKGKLIENMKLEIQRRAQGVFLWAELVVQILNKDSDRGNVSRLQTRLDEIPDGLDDLFRDILQRGVQEKSYLVQILQWILYARRPLTPQEMYLAVHSGTSDSTHIKPWDSEEIEPRAVHLFILDSSKGLAEMTKGTKRRESTVQFIHESVRDYLRKTGFGVLAPNLVEDLEGATHEYLYRCCSQWMSNDVIKHLLLPEELPKAKSPEGKDLRDNAAKLFPFLGYCASNMVYHADLALSRGTLQDHFITTFPASSFLVINNVLALHNTRRHYELRSVLAEKAATSFLALEMTSAGLGTWGQREDLEEALRLASTTDELVQFVSRASSQTIKLAVETCNVGALRALFQYKGSLIRQSIVSKMLQSRELVLHEEISEWVVAPDDYPNMKIHILKTTSKAVNAGDVDTLRSILSALYAADLLHDSASLLIDACRLGHTAIVQLLLEHGVEAQTRLAHHSVPLIAAAQCGHDAVVRTLLLHGASVGQLDVNLRSALGEACRNGHEAVVRILLEHGADVNLASGQHPSPLIAALENGHVNIVQLLLATKSALLFGAGVQDYVLDHRFSSWFARLPLTEVEHVMRNCMSEGLLHGCVSLPTCIMHVASDNGLDDLLQSLFRNNAGPDLREGKCYFDALSVASQRGHGLVVKTLIANDHGVQHRASSDYSEVAQAVVKARHGYILEILLDKSDGFRAQDRDIYIDALRQATQLGFREIVNILRQRGVTLPEDVT